MSPFSVFAEDPPLLPMKLHQCHSHEQCMRVPVPSHPHQHLLFSEFFLTVATLMVAIQKTKIMASGPIASWHIDWETVETVADFILGGYKITVDGDCSHEIKRELLLARKVMTNLDNILKCRDMTLSKKVHLVKAMVFPVIMYGCVSWTIKNAEC